MAIKIGYARVSTEDQNPDLPLATLEKIGCKRIFIEKATGTHVKQTELTRCLKTLAVGDTLIVWRLDRLGRSLWDLIGLLDDLKAWGVAPSVRSRKRFAMWQMVGDTGGTGTLSDSGAHLGGPRGGGCPWGEDGPQA